MGALAASILWVESDPIQPPTREREAPTARRESPTLESILKKGGQ